MTRFDELMGPGLALVFSMHGQLVEYAHGPSGDWYTVTGIYNPSRDVINGDHEVPLAATERVLDIRRGELSQEPDQRDRVRIDGTAFDVLDVEPGKLTYRLKLDETRRR